MFNEGNKIIKNFIENNLAESFGKIGGIESSHIANYMTTGHAKILTPMLQISAGIITFNEQQLQRWCEEYIKSIKNLDYIIEWCPEQGDRYIIEKIWNGKKKFYNFEDIEPFFHGKEGWQYSLHNKKVLVVSPFKDTIYQQAEIFNKIWDGVTLSDIYVAKSPYPPQLLEQNPKISYEFNLDAMKRDISTCEFDVAIIGCGGYSLLINEYIKNLGKPSIHLGGSAQLIFGIKGGRWDSNEKFVNSDWYGKTKYWVRPLKHEIPPQNKLLENGAYW